MKFVIVLLLAVVAVSAAPWSTCGTSADHFKITSLTITPDELAAGKPFSIVADGTFDEQVTGGTVSISVKYLGVPIFSHTYDLCTLSPDVKCPIAAGAFTLTEKETMPPVVPKGAYTGQIILKDQNGQEITCVNFNIKVSVSASDLVLDDEIIAKVNSEGKWKASRNPRFEGKTVGDVMQMLGSLPSRPNVPSVSLHAANIPDTFDARQQWPNCIHAIRDQGQCGSCWAFGASESVSDRFCIASSGSVNEVMSPQYLVSCDNTDYGCQGGYIDHVWDFMVNQGICTETCFPYESGAGSVPSCITTCKDGSPLKLYKVQNVVHPTDEASIQTEIMTNGPVEVAFQVYQDFMSYTSGVYQHTTGSFLGGHAVKAIGWGVENNQKYWLIANSWADTWGMDGFFKILRGVDECEIEDGVYSAAPVV